MTTDREALVKRLERAVNDASSDDALAAVLSAKNCKLIVAALSAQGGEQRIDLIDPLRFLVELKHIKRRMEAGTATDSEAKFYEANKETAWLNAERALAAAQEEK